MEVYTDPPVIRKHAYISLTTVHFHCLLRCNIQYVSATLCNSLLSEIPAWILRNSAIQSIVSELGVWLREGDWTLTLTCLAMQQTGKQGHENRCPVGVDIHERTCVL